MVSAFLWIHNLNDVTICMKIAIKIFNQEIDGDSQKKCKLKEYDSEYLRWKKKNWKRMPYTLSKIILNNNDHYHHKNIYLSGQLTDREVWHELSYTFCFRHII